MDEVELYQRAFLEKIKREDLRFGNLMALVRNLVREKDELPFIATDFYPQHADGLSYRDREQKAISNKNKALEMMAEMRKQNEHRRALKGK